MVQMFQSTLPRRERLLDCWLNDRRIRFQSTLPRRERPVSRIPQKSMLNCFNPRSHEGSDNNKRLTLIRLVVSIHAPTKGATTSGNEQVTHKHVSIHAPTKGATLVLSSFCQRVEVSIHAPTKGATVTGCNSYYSI